MARKLIPKSDIPKQHTLPSGLVVREFTREEIAQRRKLREQGKLVDEPVNLEPADARRTRKRFSITIDSTTARYARKLGKGNLSRGIEHAVIEYQKSQKRIS